VLSCPFTLNESVKHLVSNGSKVHCAFLDATGLYLKLIERGAPVSFIRILVTL